MAKFLRMKHLYIAITSLMALLVIGSCNNSHEVLYAINVKESTLCTHHEQEVEMTYVVHEAVANSETQFTVRCADAWATVVDCSTIGTVRIKVDENVGETRTTTITISAPGCRSAKTKLTQYSTPPEVANHTLMFYFFGTSLNRFFQTNIEDAKAAIEMGTLGNSNRIIIFRQDNANSAHISELCFDNNGGECIESIIEDNIALNEEVISPETIGSHIAHMANIAPAERYGIIFAGHGQGWITRDILNNDSDISALSVEYNPWIPAPGAEVTRAFGEKNVRVNIDELAEGIAKSGVALDYILFDACFMSNIEAIYELRNSANHIIASPCEIMGRGFPYHRTLPYLFRDEGKSSDLEGAAESYYKFYKDEYIGSTRCGSICLYDCTEIEALAEATRNVCRSAKGKDEYDIRTLQTYEGMHTHCFYDFGEWVNVVATDDSLLEVFNDQLERCVVASFSLNTFYSAYGGSGTFPINLDVYSGVTTSAPSRAYPNGWRTTNWYKDVIELEN